MAQKSVTKHNANLEEIGIDEEAWYRLWYDLYNANLNACNPQSPAVLKHFTAIPEEYKVKFMLEDKEEE